MSPVNLYIKTERYISLNVSFKRRAHAYSLGSPLREDNNEDKSAANHASQMAFLLGGCSHLLRGAAEKALVPDKQQQSSWGGAPGGVGRSARGSGEEHQGAWGGSSAQQVGVEQRQQEGRSDQAHPKPLQGLGAGE